MAYDKMPLSWQKTTGSAISTSIVLLWSQTGLVWICMDTEAYACQPDWGQTRLAAPVLCNNRALGAPKNHALGEALGCCPTERKSSAEVVLLPFRQRGHWRRIRANFCLLDYSCVSPRNHETPSFASSLHFQNSKNCLRKEKERWGLLSLTVTFV